MDVLRILFGMERLAAPRRSCSFRVPICPQERLSSGLNYVTTLLLVPEKELAELIFQNATCFYSLILVPQSLLMAEVAFMISWSNTLRFKFRGMYLCNFLANKVLDWRLRFQMFGYVHKGTTAGHLYILLTVLYKASINLLIDHFSWSKCIGGTAGGMAGLAHSSLRLLQMMEANMERQTRVFLGVSRDPWHTWETDTNPINWSVASDDGMDFPMNAYLATRLVFTFSANFKMQQA
ncbi:hypothetical protein C4D60_Mb05t20780 [Musa balbisiana]|uniref:Uncharacterized protein n=1 Tax=Musa balbisiana TaxID=52838 RepID=A0A4S8JXN5_MUSBA|nr:hypothetical protein C4D60_Mb05t20780 [Musa balbisiana]